jgi:hypothetical protein
MSSKTSVKELLGELPLTAELYWLMRNRGRKAFTRFNIDRLKTSLPQMLTDVKRHAGSGPTGKKVFIFASLHFWVEHTAITALALRGLGCDVALGYLPYSDFAKPVNKFDLRRNNLYAHDILKQAEPLLKIVPVLDLEPASKIPDALAKSVEQITVFDTRYILQCEEVTGCEPIYQLRAERNTDAARRIYAYFEKNRPDVVIVPNGMIQEFGAVFETARFLGISAVTYEFGEQDQRTWLGQNRWVIHHITTELWETRKDRVLTEEQKNWLETFLAGRQKLTTGTQFAHLWQKADRAGAEKIRTTLGLDNRPVVLLPTNVLGDSATLGLNTFSESMTEWLERVLLFLADRPEVQVVVRIHPGETLTVGPSVMEIVKKALPELPSHIHLIGPTEKVNTYDLMDLTDLALVYTTTAGLEMAVRGIPVLVSGKAHYSRKGFTLEADTWEEYFAVLERALKAAPARLTDEQIALAWTYAYFFFAEYPQPFPWHVEKIASAMEKRPLSYVLGPQGRAEYEQTFRKIAGIEIIPNHPIVDLSGGSFDEQ